MSGEAEEQPVDDRTVVTPRPATAPPASASPATVPPAAVPAVTQADAVDDRTVVVPGGAAAVSEETVVAPRARAGSSAAPDVGAGEGGAGPVEATVVAPRRGRRAARRADEAASAEASQAGAAPAGVGPAGADDDRTVVAAGFGGLSPEQQAQMFKKPLDPRRAVVESPFPQTEGALPKRGVRPGMPVLYTPRSGAAEDQDAARAEALEQRIGPPPPAHPIASAQRDGLPSTARANRRFGVAVLAGFAAALVVSALGLWGIAVLAFG